MSRYGFDVSIPIYSLHGGINDNSRPWQEETLLRQRRWLLLSSQLHYHPKFHHGLTRLASDNRVLILQRCSSNTDHKEYYQRCSRNQSISYPTILQVKL